MKCRIHGKKRHELIYVHHHNLLLMDEEHTNKRFTKVDWHGITEKYDYCCPHWVWVTDIDYEPIGSVFNRKRFCQIVNCKIGLNRFDVLSKTTGITEKTCKQIFYGEMIPSIILIEKLAKGLNIPKQLILNEV